MSRGGFYIYSLYKIGWTSSEQFKSNLSTRNTFRSRTDRVTKSNMINCYTGRLTTIKYKYLLLTLRMNWRRLWYFGKYFTGLLLSNHASLAKCRWCHVNNRVSRLSHLCILGKCSNSSHQLKIILKGRLGGRFAHDSFGFSDTLSVPLSQATAIN